MNRKSMLFMIFFGIALTGCASDPNRSTVAADTQSEQAVSKKNTTVAATNESRADQVGDGVICRLEKTIGSHRSRKVCRSVGDIESTMRKTQGDMNSRGRSGSASGGSGN